MFLPGCNMYNQNRVATSQNALVPTFLTRTPVRHVRPEMTGPGVIGLAMRQVITLELDLSALRQAIGGGSYVRGAEYARQQAVLHVTWDPEDTVLGGMVRGQGGNVYQTAAFFSLADGQPAEFET